MIGKLTFHHFQYSKKAPTIIQDFPLRKVTFRSFDPKRLIQKSWSSCFFYISQKTYTYIFSFGAVQWEARELLVDPKKHCFLGCTATNKNVRVLGFFKIIQEQLLQDFRSNCFGLRDPNVMFPAKKFWMIACDFFAFSKRPKASSTIILTLKNTRNNTAYAV